MARNDYCSTCDIRKFKRRPTGDKAIKKKGVVTIEYLGYECPCGRKWRQKINYGAGEKIKWEKVS